jgi:hypothetical protein
MEIAGEDDLDHLKNQPLTTPLCVRLRCENVRNSHVPRIKTNSVKLAVPMDGAEIPLSNVEIGELLATAAETSRQPLQKAFRRAARKACCGQKKSHLKYLFLLLSASAWSIVFAKWIFKRKQLRN